MSGAEGRKNTAAEELQMVHNRIEQCLSSYMTEHEIIKALYVQHNIDPRFTQLVWEQLERQNQEFFKEYYLRLKVKEQIIEFNRLLAKQAERMCLPGSSGIASTIAISNGSKTPSACGNVENGGPVLKSEDVHRRNSATLSNVFDSGGTSLHHPGIETAVDLSSHSTNIDVSRNILLGHDSSDGGGTCPPIDYIPYGMCDPPVSSFSRIESDSSEQLNGTMNHLNGTLVDIDPSLFGYLGQNSLNFGFSDLGDEFTDVPGLLSVSLSLSMHNQKTNNVEVLAEILGSYSRSSFLSPDTSNFPDTHGLVENQGNVASSSISPENFRCIEHGDKN